MYDGDGGQQRTDASRLARYGVTCARRARMFAIDLEGHALSWPLLALATGGPRSVVAVFGAGDRKAMDQRATDATAARPSIWLRPQAALGIAGNLVYFTRPRTSHPL